MRIIITFLGLMMLSFGASFCYALDWKDLHQESEKVALQKALDNSIQAPDSIENLYVLGLVYLDNYKYEDADKTFQRILDKDSKNFEARWGIAEVLRRKHEYEKSVPILKEIIKMHPGFAPAYITLAYIEYIQMDFKASAQLTGQVINFDEESLDLSNHVRAHGLYAGAKGMMAQYGGPFSKSVNFFAVQKHLNIANSLQPDSFTVYFGFGSYYLSIPPILGRDLDKAEKFLLKAVELDPLFADTYVRLAQISKSRGDQANFTNYIVKALELDPKNELALDVKNGTCKFICLEGFNE